MTQTDYGASSGSSSLCSPEPQGVSAHSGDDPARGYVDAFYEIAGMLGFGARSQAPKEVWESEMRPRLKAVLAALKSGEEFLAKCNSAWACGEPEHRVRDMLNAADDFQAALNKMEAFQ